MKKTIIIFAVLCVLMLSGCAVSTDPFNSPPKGTSPNCGPEHRYQFNVTIDSKQDFVEFIKNNEIDKREVRLDDFKDENGEVDWEKVSGAVKTQRTMSGTIYSIEYTPLYCSLYTLKMSNDGQVSLYGCCGK